MERDIRLYLARHGQIYGFEKGIICGFTDNPLTDIGLMQMERLSDRLRLNTITSIYSSDLQRCYRGAQIVARDHNARISKLSELRELNFGTWEGLSLSEVKERFPEEIKKRHSDIINYKIKGGETIHDFSKRIIKCFDSIINNNHGKDILIIAHGGVNRIILCYLLGIEFSRLFNIEQNYGCLNVIDFYPDQNAIIQLING
jgi:alpha-ribazole phosphatase